MKHRKASPSALDPALCLEQIVAGEGLQRQFNQISTHHSDVSELLQAAVRFAGPLAPNGGKSLVGKAICAMAHCDAEEGRDVVALVIEVARVFEFEILCGEGDDALAWSPYSGDLLGFVAANQLSPLSIRVVGKTIAGRDLVQAWRILTMVRLLPQGMLSQRSLMDRILAGIHEAI